MSYILTIPEIYFKTSNLSLQDMTGKLGMFQKISFLILTAPASNMQNKTMSSLGEKQLKPLKSGYILAATPHKGDSIQSLSLIRLESQETTWVFLEVLGLRNKYCAKD